MKFFVWLKGLRQPVPQMWSEDFRNQKERPNKIDVLEFYELKPGQENLSYKISRISIHTREAKMKMHRIKYYLENHVAIPYCEICSAEGEMLLCDCPGEFVSPSTQPKNENSVGKRVDMLERNF